MHDLVNVINAQGEWREAKAEESAEAAEPIGNERQGHLVPRHPSPGNRYMVDELVFDLGIHRNPYDEEFDAEEGAWNVMYPVPGDDFRHMFSFRSLEDALDWIGDEIRRSIASGVGRRLLTKESTS